MPVSIDPEFVAALEPLLPRLGDPLNFPVGDVLSRRAEIDRRWALAMETWPVVNNVEHYLYTAKSSDNDIESERSK